MFSCHSNIILIKKEVMSRGILEWGVWGNFSTLVFKSQSSQSDELQTIVMTSDQIQIPDPTDPNFQKALVEKGANAYSTRKTAVEGVLNTASLTRTALMLKDYTQCYQSTGPENVVIILCCIAILVIFATGVLFVFIGKTNWENKSERAKLEKMNDASLILVITIVFLEVILGVFDTRKVWKLCTRK